MLAEGAAAPERAVEVDVDDVQPMFVGDPFGWRFASRYPGAIDEDIDLAVPCRKLVRHLGDASGTRHVHDDGLGIVAFCLEGGAAGLGRLRIPIGNDDLRPRLRQRFRARKSDSLASACDDSDAATKSEFFQIHLSLCSWLQVDHWQNHRATFRSLARQSRRYYSLTSERPLP